MCTVMAYLGQDMTKEEMEQYLQKTPNRGPDAMQTQQVESGWMGFARLSIMGLNAKGMQPFEKDGSYVVCNGEIYNYRQRKEQLQEKGYTFLGESDCEVLLPMYQEYGLEMFRFLDAEFACILYDAKEKEWIAARDPIGIRPMFYGYSESGHLAFASEARNLVGLVKEIMPFPPGHYYYKGEFHCYHDVGDVLFYRYETLPEITKNIREKLIRAVEKRLDSDAPMGFLLSGGLDSALVCSIAARISKKPIRTFAIGMDTDAIDLKYARQVADFIGSEHTEIIMTQKDVFDTVEKLISVLGTYDITTIRASLGMYLISKAIHETTDIKVLLTGEISDELFGYKYTDFAPTDAAFQSEAQKRMRELYCYDVLRADRCLADNSLEARVPFGDLEFVRYIMSIDPGKKRNSYGKGKYLLRMAFAEGDWLPENILWREKAAFSDAVGHSMADGLKAYAQTHYSDKEYEEKRKKYDFARPFTKESLWYREMFEKYFKGQARMIPGFWMPNKEWKGCDVNDPSARVLSNYGDSGK